jgi:hypothetical protein
MGESVTLHSRFNRTVAVALWVLSVVVVAGASLGDLRLVPLCPAAALLSLFAWAALWRPGVRVDEVGVAVQNVTHSVAIPWAALIHVETRYALTLHAPSGTFTAWSAPAPGLVGSLRASRRTTHREARAADGALRAGDLIGTDSGSAATVVREQWRRRLDSGQVQTGIADDIPVRRVWDVPVLVLLVALSAASIWALAASG